MLKSLLNNEKSRTVAGNYIALLLIQGANIILPLLTLPYLIRTIGTERFGLVMIAQAIGVFLTIIVDFGFNISATREVSLLRNDKEKLSQLYWNVFYIKSILLLITFLVVVVLITTISRFKAEAFVYILSFGMVLGQAIFPTWFFQGIEKMKVITFINVLAKILFTIAVFLFILNPSDYELVPLFNGGGFIISGIIGLIYSLKFVNFKKPDYNQIKSLTKDTSSLFVSNFATSLYTSGNTFILGMLGGDAIAGIYSSMEKLVLALKNVFVPLYQAIFPWLATKGPKEMRSFIKKMTLPIGLIGLIITITIVCIAKPLLHFIYDDPKIDNYSYIFQILALIALFSALNMLLVSLYYPAAKYYNKRMYALVAGGLFNLCMALIIGYYYGITGIAIVAVCSELFILIVAKYLFNKINV
ncbi:oligosaccharide flippase family protein [uncultured Dokdonia sp.]|uniref:oligosaccharide flippase family protein n=1 Tax=uncultured Dokdonia sp. TaxID=575653 RepID=UPI00262D09FC|nr:oligosaccharide flippase family protein [uncultured Dokdonia sp.]